MKIDTTPPFATGSWQVDPRSLELRRADGSVCHHLAPQNMAVLVYLALNNGRVVSRQEIMEAVWQGRAVTDDALTVAIYQLRRALGETSRDSQLLETIKSRGYRWLAATSSLPPGQANPAPSECEVGTPPLAEQAGPVTDDAPELAVRSLAESEQTAAKSIVSEPSRRRPQRASGPCLGIQRPRSPITRCPYASGQNGVRGLPTITPSKSPQTSHMRLMLSCLGALLLGWWMGRAQAISAEGEQLLWVRTFDTQGLANGVRPSDLDRLAQEFRAGLSGHLALVPGIQVHTEESTLRHPRDPDLIVDGSLTPQRDQLSILLALRDSPQDRPLWVQSFEGPLEELPRLQQQAAQAMLRAMGHSLLQTQPAFDELEIPACDRAQWHRDCEVLAGLPPEDLRRAEAHSFESVELTPHFAEAHTSREEVYPNQVFYVPQGQSDERIAKAKDNVPSLRSENCSLQQHRPSQQRRLQQPILPGCWIRSPGSPVSSWSTNSRLNKALCRAGDGPESRVRFASERGPPPSAECSVAARPADRQIHVSSPHPGRARRHLRLALAWATMNPTGRDP